MSQPPAPQPRSLRFYLELFVVLGLTAAAVVYAASAWRGPWRPLERPEPAETAEVLADGSRRALALRMPAEKRAALPPALSAMRLKIEESVSGTPDGTPRISGAEKSAPRLKAAAARGGHEFSRELSAPAEQGGDGPRVAPKLFEKPPIAEDAPALARPGPERILGKPTWAERIARDPWLFIGAVAAAFLASFALLAKALRRGPGSHGLTHD